jgi:Carboxypeptidase regulatory-like domain
MAKVRAVLTIAVGLTLCGALGAASASAATGSISGTVKSAAADEGIGEIVVCAYSPNPGTGGRCVATDPDGKYSIEGLQPDVYKVGFEEAGQQKNYLGQWYPAKAIVEEAQLVPVQSGEDVTGIDATLTVGGQITGTVTDVADGEPIEGIEVCAPQIDRVTEFGVIHCDKSDADGKYTVWALPTGQFKLEFGPAIFQRDAPNYIRQYYPGKPTWAEAEVRAVTAGVTYPGIDAALQKGIGIAGTVTEAGGGPVAGGPRICALDAASGAIVQCTGVEMDGTYWMPGLPFGSYVVSFAVDVEEEPGLILHPDGFVRQYYKGKPTFGEADVLASAGSTVFSSIDAQLVRGPETFPSKRPPALPPVVVTLLERPVPRALHCRKHFRKKLVKGQRRCVKVHKRHRHRHRHGPRAHATGS